jgi:glycosyltransferase involved in cell wall biosynthesis
VDDPDAQRRLRAAYAGDRLLVGHFGTYSRHITGALESCLPALVARVDCSVLLLGRTSAEVARALVAAHPSLDGRLYATGTLSPEDVSRHIGACDIMLQPYPDGVSSRRTSAMAALSHGIPMVTTIGPLSEALWSESGAATLVPVEEMGSLADAAASLLTSPARRQQLAARAQALYRDRFALQHTVNTLRTLPCAS